jgi:hypothetical protein
MGVKLGLTLREERRLVVFENSPEEYICNKVRKCFRRLEKTAKYGAFWFIFLIRYS